VTDCFILVFLHLLPTDVCNVLSWSICFYVNSCFMSVNMLVQDSCVLLYFFCYVEHNDDIVCKISLSALIIFDSP
jgi:hypothetical protein